MNASAVLALLFAACSWGSMFLVCKPVLAHVSPLWFTTLRYSCAVLPLALLLWRFGDRPALKLRHHWRALTGLGVLGYGFFGVLTLSGLSLSVPSHGAVLMATMPLTTLLLRWVLDGQRPGLRVAGAAVLALSGVVLVSGLAGGGNATPHALAGDALTLLGTVGWVLYTRGAARWPDFSALEYSALTAITGVPCLLLVAIGATLAGGSQAPSREDLAAVLPHLAYVAAIPTIAAVLAFNYGVRQLGAARASLFLNGVPVSALLMSVALGQHPSAQEWLGALLVIAALTLANRSAPTAASPAPAPLPAGVPPCPTA
ncbi:Permease of the drug/metabolite transporter (DMT) superfamily [Roseateles sp. YR242]|uniref:DMT family transporter n=1 Tax=Roseateles sp. YR242 TaxID=1855305 RepID=UPI0008C4FE16|nr:DMT family transporter [Roseateles sp. YR242]SEL79496.1 Permease of the drug/metabolite transporter (DMT) superfamily [Roseateles sp. YR242]